MQEEETAGQGIEPEGTLPEPALEPLGPEPAGEASGDAQIPEPPRQSRRLRKILFWAVAVLLLFGLGVGACWVTQVQPLRERLASSEARAVEAENRAATLQADVERLSPFEAENATLQGQLVRSRQHLDLLYVLVDVTSAQLAMAQQDAVAARAALSGTDARLGSLQSNLEAADAGTVRALRERLSLVLQEVETDEFAARNDLEILANNLLSLERSLFGE